VEAIWSLNQSLRLTYVATAMETYLCLDGEAAENHVCGPEEAVDHEETGCDEKESVRPCDGRKASANHEGENESLEKVSHDDGEEKFCDECHDHAKGATPRAEHPCDGSGGSPCVGLENVCLCAEQEGSHEGVTGNERAMENDEMTGSRGEVTLTCDDEACKSRGHGPRNLDGEEETWSDEAMENYHGDGREFPYEGTETPYEKSGSPDGGSWAIGHIFGACHGEVEI
jgi:hypothetical protein